MAIRDVPQRVPWTQQPQVPVGIDRSNQITRGLGLLATPNLEFVTSTPRGTVLTGYTIGNGIGGIAAIGPATQIPGYVAVDPSIPVTINGDCTILLVGQSVGPHLGVSVYLRYDAVIA